MRLQAIADTWILKENRPTQFFKSKSSFVFLIGSPVTCIKIRTNGLDAMPGFFHMIMSDLAFAAIVNVDNYLLAIAQFVNENKSQKTGSEKTADFTLISWTHDLSSNFALEARLII